MSSMEDFVLQHRYTGGTVLNFSKLRLVTARYESKLLALLHSFV